MGSNLYGFVFFNLSSLEIKEKIFSFSFSKATHCWPMYKMNSWDGAELATLYVILRIKPLNCTCRSILPWFTNSGCTMHVPQCAALK